MNEGQPSPDKYNYTKEDLKIPENFRMDESRMDKLTSRNSHEEKIGYNDLYSNPYFIAERIREIKREYYNPKLNPGAERKMELMEEYERLKLQRENTKKQIVKDLEFNNTNVNGHLSAIKKRREKMQKDFEIAQEEYKNKEMTNDAKLKWQTADDFIRLFEEENMSDLNLEDEDEGLKGLSS
ncbi:MAG: hypothetical protein M1429_00685 [Patescibacteria group bacterium]|nr:hypothetical protein [Patescibacteria group bacterium]